MSTPPEEIQRQHDRAVELLLANAIPCGERRQHGEIPLACKEVPTCQLFGTIHEEKKEEEEDKGDGSNGQDNSKNDHSQDQDDKMRSFFPCWTSRGQVDISKLRALVLEGYNTIQQQPQQEQQSKEEDEKKEDDASVVSTSTTATTASTTTTKNTPNKKLSSRKRYTGADIKSVTNLWDPANAAVNNVAICRPSHDGWGIGKIIFIFCDDFIQHCYHLPWWHGRSDLRQAIQPIMDTLALDPNRIVRMLLASLPRGVTIPIHHDSGEWVKYTHRVHVPVIVKDPSKIVFQCGLTETTMERIDCSEGHVFEINNQGKHAVSNCSDDHRVHLILDYVDPDFVTNKKVPLQPTLLEPGEVVFQTRRSLDRFKDKGQRPIPYFCILGAQKAGTTSLYEYIIQHPLVVPARRRETHCLDWRWNYDTVVKVLPQQKKKTFTSMTSAQQQDYLRLAFLQQFYHAEQLKLHPSCCTGDSTPSYLMDSRRVIPRLQQVFTAWQQMKFLVTIREPVARAESHYAMVTSTEGTPAQLKARGSEWRSKSFWQVVQDDLTKMKECGLLPHWNMDTGVCDDEIFQQFAGSAAEEEAWNLYMSKHVPLNTGSYGLLSRGLYDLQLRPWIKWLESNGLSPNTSLLVLTLESLQDPPKTMKQVWSFLDLPQVTLEDTAPKNTRNYVPSLQQQQQQQQQDGNTSTATANVEMNQTENNNVVNDAVDAATRKKYLENFYAPYNQRLQQLLVQHGWDTHTYSYSTKDTHEYDDDDK